MRAQERQRPAHEREHHQCGRTQQQWAAATGRFCPPGTELVEGRFGDVCGPLGRGVQQLPKPPHVGLRGGGLQRHGSGFDRRQRWYRDADGRFLGRVRSSGRRGGGRRWERADGHRPTARNAEPGARGQRNAAAGAEPHPALLAGLIGWGGTSCRSGCHRATAASRTWTQHMRCGPGQCGAAIEVGVDRVKVRHAVVGAADRGCRRSRCPRRPRWVVGDRPTDVGAGAELVWGSWKLGGDMGRKRWVVHGRAGRYLRGLFQRRRHDRVRTVVRSRSRTAASRNTPTRSGRSVARRPRRRTCARNAWPARNRCPHRLRNSATCSIIRVHLWELGGVRLGFWVAAVSCPEA